MDDQRIIELYFARAESAIAETDRKYGPSCRRLAERITGNRLDAEECVNDTYLAAWNAIPPARPDPLSAFLLKITRNLSFKRYHYNSAEKRNSYYDSSFEELADCLGEEEPMAPASEDRLTVALIEAFLDGLTPENRVIFLRRYWFADSYAEISARVGLPEKSISMRLVRMRQSLREYLRKEGILV